jgi:subtilisin-like proprotein convertase family protein
LVLQVRLAQKWQTVPEQNTCARSAPKASLIIAGKTRNKAAVEVKECEKVKYLEHVQVHVSLSASKRGDVQITLISPGGTRSVLIDKRPKDYSRLGFNDWPFLTVRRITFRVPKINEG